MIDVIKRAKLDPNNVVCIYKYGSRIYGNYNKKSDHDFIVVMRDKPNNDFSDNLININFFTEEEHQQRLLDHEISALETLFLDGEHIILEKEKYWFALDLSKLRHSLSAKASNSFVKAKKKLTIEKDYDLAVGRKSLWHSFRIIDFGIQIAKYGEIRNYDSCNDLFYEIMNHYTWDELFEKYKKKHNKLMSEFRKLAPKNEKERNKKSI
jgi:hypothetical protein